LSFASLRTLFMYSFASSALFLHFRFEAVYLITKFHEIYRQETTKKRKSNPA